MSIRLASVNFCVRRQTCERPRDHVTTRVTSDWFRGKVYIRTTAHSLTDLLDIVELTVALSFHPVGYGFDWI